MTTFDPSRLSACVQMEFPWMSSAAASPARTSALQGAAQASPANDLASGLNLPGSLARYDPVTCSWRTSQLCLDGVLETFSETWPRSGMMRSGTAFPLRPLVPLTAATGSGLWPTPRANENDQGAANRQAMLDAGSSWKGQRRGATLATMVKCWPTPRAMDGAKGSRNLTPGCVAHVESGRGNLAEMVQMFPTPTARDYRTGDRPDSRRARMKQAGDWHSPNLNDVAAPGGQLNPTWVEWLMGLPLGWTDCGDLATRSSRKSRS